MKKLRYYKEFRDVNNVLYRVEILQENFQGEASEVELASDPVTIEWPEVMKIDPVMPSGATLRLISMSDRQFADLYTVEPCTIRLDVYRAGVLYWSGTLDTELFQEPYAYNRRYVTEVTFSDFGVLDRLSWAEQGLKTMREVLNICLSATQIIYGGVTEYISTTIPNVEAALLDGCLLSMENFYDENGEAWTIREVLNEVLRPFSLQMRQKNGRIYISDLNSLATHSTKDVEWLNANSTLGVEPTYNKAVIRFSPYSEAILFDGEFDSDKIIPDTSAQGIGKTSVILPETEYNGFDIYYTEPYTEPTEVQKMIVSGGARIFRIKADNSGSDSTGVMWGIRPTGDSWIGEAPRPLIWETSQNLTEIMRSPKIPIQVGEKSQYLKLSLEVLLDVRFNPFEQGGDENDKKAWERFNDWANYGMIPISLRFYSKSGETLQYSNYALWRYAGANINGSIFKMGNWSVVGQAYPFAWLAYYNQGNRKSATGFGDWQGNNQTIGFTPSEIPKYISLNLEGEKIPLPSNSAGEIELIIYAGFDARDNAEIADPTISQDVATMVRWMLYRNPKLEVVSESGKALDVEDVEVSAWINKSAEEETSIDTFIGTATERTPMARGAIISTKDYLTIEYFKRANVVDKLERLALSTIYSNYAQRRSTLEGTIKLIPENAILSDKSAVNGRFVVVSATENIQQATSEIKMAEFANDTFVGLEYE